MGKPEPTWVSDCGRATLYCGDCLEVASSLPDSSLDLVITSPPYNCGKDYGKASDSREWADYWSWTEQWVYLCCTKIAHHGYLCVNHANWIGSREERVLVVDELCPILDRHMPRKDHIIWDKGPANGAGWGNYQTAPRIRAQHENIYIHGGKLAMPNSDITWADWSRFTTSIWRIAPVAQDIHPAMMPIDIPRRLCLLYSPANGTVLDPFTGSGTTGLAAIKTGRRFIGIELEPKYFEIAKRRIKEELESNLFLSA